MQLAYLHQANAQYTRVDDTSSGRGTITCPTGEQHEGAISISSTSTPSMSGYYDIVIATNGSSALKSGVFDYVKIYSSGEFILKGKETRDDICGSLTNVASIPIEITGQSTISISDHCNCKPLFYQMAWKAGKAKVQLSLLKGGIKTLGREGQTVIW